MRYLRRLLKEITVQDKTLFISAGHSDKDPGAVGSGCTEADLVLVFRDKVSAALDEMGIVHSKDGVAGENLNLRTASSMAAKNDVAVEFHFNAFSKPSATGTEVLANSKDEKLAALLSDAVSSRLGIPNRGVKPESAGQHSRLAFLRAGGMILEIAFIRNPDDVSSFLQKEEELAVDVAEILADSVARLY